MRIVDVNAFYTPQGGGVKTYVDRKLAAMGEAGDEIIILAPGPEDQTRILSERTRIVTIRSPHFALDRRYHHFNDEAALHAALDRLSPDWVEASSPWRSAAMVARWQGSAGRSLIMHCDPLTAYAYRWFGRLLDRHRIDRGFDLFWQHLRRLDRQFDHVVAASSDLADRLREGGLSRVRLLPMGVAPDRFSPALRDEMLRRRLLAACALSADATLLLAVGRLAPEKRLDTVIQGVIAAGAHAPVGLAIVGGGRDERSVRRAIARCPHVQIIPPITDRAQLARVMASADIFVHGCEAETFGMVAAEARASGLPLIVPDTGGSIDQLQPGCGLTYRAGDAADLKAAIAAMCQSAIAPYRRNAQAGAATVPTMDAHFRSLLDLYQHRQEWRVAA